MSESLKQYYQALSAKGKFAMEHKRKNGETMHLAPFGFRNIRGDGRSTIAPDPEMFPLAMLALRMRQDGCTLREICTVMTKKGLLSKRGKPIQPNGMDKILKTFSRLVEAA